jgi:hypothetical protein
LEDIYLAGFDPDNPHGFDFEAALSQVEIQDWQKEHVRTAEFVERYHGGRVIAIPTTRPYDAYNEMQEFIATIQDDQLR